METWTFGDGIGVTRDGPALGEDGMPRAWICAGNPLRTPFDALLEHADGRPAICWAGSLAEGVFDAVPANWMREGQERLDAWSEQAAEEATRRDARVYVRTHAAGVLSDPPGCARWLGRWRRPGLLGLVVDPVAMLTPSMMGEAEDHLRRIYEVLGPDERVDGWVLASPAGGGVSEPAWGTSDGVVAELADEWLHAGAWRLMPGGG